MGELNITKHVLVCSTFYQVSVRFSWDCRFSTADSYVLCIGCPVVGFCWLAIH